MVDYQCHDNMAAVLKRVDDDSSDDYAADVDAGMLRGQRVKCEEK